MCVEDDTALLVMAASGGDREAFGDLVVMHWERLVRLARSVAGEADAEDVVQEGLMTAWVHLAKLADPDRFGSWVTQIVYRRCLRRARYLRRFVFGRPADGLGDQAAEIVDGIALWQMLSRLAPRQRAVLHLTIVEGMTDSEIAGSLGITAGSVRAHRRRARQRLAVLMNGRSA